MIVISIDSLRLGRIWASSATEDEHDLLRQFVDDWVEAKEHVVLSAYSWAEMLAFALCGTGRSELRRQDAHDFWLEMLTSDEMHHLDELDIGAFIEGALDVIED